MAAVPTAVLVDGFPVAVQRIAGQGHDVKRVHDRDRVGNGLGGGGLEPGEPVHRDHLDPGAEGAALSVEPSLEHCFGAAFDHVQQPS